MTYKFSKNINQYKVLVPENRYQMKILDITEGKSKSTGNDMITIELDIYSGSYATCFSNKPLRFYIVKDLSKKDGLEKFEKKLAGFCLMVRQSNNLPIDVQEFKPEEFKGLLVGAFIEQKEDSYEGHDFIKNNLKYFCTIEDVTNFVYVPTDKQSKKLNRNKPEETEIDSFDGIPFN